MKNISHSHTSQSTLLDSYSLFENYYYPQMEKQPVHPHRDLRFQGISTINVSLSTFEEV